MSSQVLRAVQASKDEAARQGSMFVEADHILLGILSLGDGSSASRALAGLGLNHRGVRGTLDKQLAIPVLNPLRPSDVEVGTLARAIISDATCYAEGCSAVSTAHVLRVLVEHPTCRLRDLVQAQGPSAEQAIQQIISAASDGASEEVAEQRSVPAVEEQVAGLQREYRRMQQQGAGADHAAGAGARRETTQQTDDDIYE